MAATQCNYCHSGYFGVFLYVLSGSRKQIRDITLPNLKENLFPNTKKESETLKQNEFSSPQTFLQT